MPYKNPQDPRRIAQQKKWRERNPDYHKQWVKDNPGKKYVDRNKRYEERNRLKVNARHAVYWAVKSGRLVRPSVCSSCFNTGKIEADHHDYTKPLDVTWLCHPCHVAITIARRKCYTEENKEKQT